MKSSAAVDQYILKAQDFAQPILEHLRFLVHQTCPQVEETIKWGFPNFEYNGKILCHMAAFKAHCTFGFWNAKDIDDNGILEKVGKTAMGQLGKIKSLNDIPDSETMYQLINSAMLGIENHQPQKKVKSPKAPLEIPDYFVSILKKDKHLHEAFNTFSTSQQREYIDWFEDAKTEATREKRIATALEWIAEGKSRNWKYARK
ncbi:MAG TPA: YdeI/OmpD-associated family protein [Bacteroidia bacterium]